MANQPSRIVGSLLSRKPSETPAVARAEPESTPAWLKEFAAAVAQIPALLKAIAQKEPAQPKAPPAPTVQVSPQFQIQTPTAWDVEITERDNNGRAKRISIKSVTHG